MSDKEFYIGYLPKMPKDIKGFVRPAVIGLLVVGFTLGIVFVVAQRPFAKSFFDFTDLKEFEGTIQARPLPFLIVETDRRTDALPALSRIPLVSTGKYGADAEIAEFDGNRVKLKGLLIRREGMQMIEVAVGSVEKTDGPAGNVADQPDELGTRTLRGEIIDSKCYLGVMNPGNHKTHRSCAVACLRGGVPPMFLVKDREGRKSELWLLNEKGQSITKEILDYVAEPVEISGRVMRRGDQLFFHADPTSIKRQ